MNESARSLNKTTTKVNCYAQRFKTEKQRFLEKVDKASSPNDCWLWLGSKRRGYGSMTFKFKNTFAHRIAWMLFSGKIPDGLDVLHTCPGGDNRLCVNPNHLRLGTHTENMADKAFRGQAAKGSENGHSKLTEADVTEIRRRRANGEKRKPIAKHYKITVHHLSEICLRQFWKHIP